MTRWITLLAMYLPVTIALSSSHASATDHERIKLVSQNQNRFAIDLYKTINTEEVNIIFSPYSIYTALALTYAGARAETAEQIAAILHLSPENESFHSDLAEIQRQLNAIEQSKEIQLSIANSMWLQERYHFLKEYVELAENSYQTEMTSVDYGKNTETIRQEINSWVERNTNEKIKVFLSKAPDPITRFMLVNAIYFKGDWVTQFDRSQTTEMPFYLHGNETIEVPMMGEVSKFNYGEDAIVQVLWMPYASERISMVVLLPRALDGLHKVEEMLAVDILEEWNKRSRKRLVSVCLPRFEMTGELDLKKVLRVMGITDAFDINKANFAGVDGDPHWLYIGSADHKAFINVNEEGTEAAAATGVGFCFPSGTEVLTDLGPQPIETIEGGEEVYAFDMATGEWVVTVVTERLSHQYSGEMITIRSDNSSIQATGNHPFYVLRGDRLAARPLPQDIPDEERGTTGEGRWVEARDLKEGDTLKVKNGVNLIITGLVSRNIETRVYNLNVEAYHNYAVDQKGILVHNKATPPPIEFRADHPFLFLLRDNLTGTILFMGRVSNPSINEKYR